MPPAKRSGSAGRVSQSGQRTTETTEETTLAPEEMGEDSVHSVHSVTKETLEATARVRPWQRGLFAFLRALRATVEEDGQDRAGFGISPTRAFRDELCEWHAATGLDSISIEDALAEAAAQWPKIRFPAGGDVLALVRRTLGAEPEPADADTYDDPRYRRLVHACLALQRHTWPKPFFLTCWQAANLAGFADRRQAHRAFKLLDADGLVVLVERGNAKRASRFEYVGPAFKRERASHES